MRYSFYLLMVISVCALLWACTDNEHIPPVTPQKEILVLFAPNALGDNGYNDQILRGVVQYAGSSVSSHVMVDYYNPTSLAEGERMIKAWRDTASDGKKRLLVLASEEYKEAVLSILENGSLDGTDREMLLFESNSLNLHGVSTFRLSMYGVAYMAGAIAGEMNCTPLAALANASDRVMREAYDGFCDGYATYSHEAETVDAVYLSSAGQGYAMADSVYRLMYDWAKRYDYIFPVMGGSNMGVFKYMREYPRGLFTVGTDVDQSHLCSQVIGSMVKHIDRVVKEYLEQWATGNALPRHRQYGMESGYVEWAASHNYEGVFDELLEQAQTEAVEKERSYGKK